MLVSKEFRYDSYTGEYELSSFAKMEKSERRVSDKKKLLEDIQNELSLLENQLFNIYKTEVRYMLMTNEVIKSCQKWLSMQETGTDNDGNKLDKRKKYPEKETFGWFSDYLKGVLGLDSFVINKIHNWNFGEGWIIYFNDKWSIEIPVIDSIGLKSFKNYGKSCFKIKLSYYEREGFSHQFASTFEEDELAELMKQGIAKYGNN